MEQELVTYLPQLGLGGIFLIMVGILWKSLQEKDKTLQNTHEKVLQAFQKNTEVSEGLKNAVQENSKVTETLSDRVYETLIHKDNDKH